MHTIRFWVSIRNFYHLKLVLGSREKESSFLHLEMKNEKETALFIHDDRNWLAGFLSAQYV
jgi:hypothetical protein